MKTTHLILAGLLMAAPTAALAAERRDVVADEINQQPFHARNYFLKGFPHERIDELMVHGWAQPFRDRLGTPSSPRRS